MALIKLTLSEMSNVKSQISSLAERTESNGTAVARIASNLDMEVKARQNIEEQLQKIKNDLNKQSQKLTAYSNLLNDVMNQFVSADSKKKNSIAGIIFKVGAVGGAFSSAIGIIKNGSSFFDWIRNETINKILNNSKLFLPYKQNGCLVLPNFDFTNANKGLKTNQEIKDTLFYEKNAVDFVDNINDILEGYGAEVPEGLKDISGSVFFKGIGYYKDFDDLMEAYKNGTLSEELAEKAEKYIKKASSKALGGNFAAKFIVNTSWNMGEHLFDFEDYVNSGNNMVDNAIGYCQYLYHMKKVTNEAVLESINDMAADWIDSTGKLVGFDFNGYMKETYGAEGGEGIMNMYKEIQDTTLHAIQTIGLKKTAECYVEGTAEAFKGLYDNVSNWNEAASHDIENFVNDCCGTVGSVFSNAKSSLLNFFK